MVNRKHSIPSKSSQPARSSARPAQGDSTKLVPEAAGFYRVHFVDLESDEWLTVYMALDGSLRMNREGRRPWLGKALLGSEGFLFELVPKDDKVARLIWGDGDSDMALEFGSGSLRVGKVVRLRSMDGPDDAQWDYSLRGLSRV